MARIPIDASHDVQISFQDLNNEIDALRKELAKLKGVSGDIDAVQQNVTRLSKIANSSTVIDPQDVFRGAGPAHSVGYVPDPGVSSMVEGAERFLREDAKWKPLLTPFRFTNDRFVKFNLNGDLGVAGTIRCTRLRVDSIVGRVPCAEIFTTSFTHTSTGNWQRVNAAITLVDYDGIVGFPAGDTVRALIARTEGWYWFWGICAFANNLTGWRYAAMAKNGTYPSTGTLIGYSGIAPTGDGGYNICPPLLGMVFMSKGDYLTLAAYQSSGGNLGMVDGLTEYGMRYVIGF